jgi:hypothetical protein
LLPSYRLLPGAAEGPIYTERTQHLVVVSQISIYSCNDQITLCPTRLPCTSENQQIPLRNLILLLSIQCIGETVDEHFLSKFIKIEKTFRHHLKALCG